jgi:hypothetical protein
MKRLFTLCAFIILVAAGNVLKAQNCDFAQAGVRLNSSHVDPVTGHCIINVDLYYDLRTNAASKYVIMHIWPKSLYPFFAYDHHPTATDLVGATTVVVRHFQEHSLSHLVSYYTADPVVIPEYLEMNISIGTSTISAEYERFTITNLNLDVAAGCDIPQAFITDVWATQSESMNNVHCFITGKEFYTSNPRITGLLYCNWPRNFSVQISSIDPEPMTVGYDVYIDNGDNIFNKTEDLVKIKSETGIIVSTGKPYNSGILSYLPYSEQYPVSEQVLWVELSGASLPNTVITALENICSALPVELKSFSVKKSGQAALLEWITASENANRGFYIERKTGSADWVTLGFVNTKAENGFSKSDISYTHVDAGLSKGVVQYRLKQTGLDGKYSYSPVRSIRGDEMPAIVIFLNPSAGIINIVFPDADAGYNMLMFSEDGKLVKKWQDCQGSFSIRDQKAGFYIMKIENRLTRDVSIHKILVH